MANGSYRLDLKRDDARTLMMKMDARLTYAGRERNAAFQLEGQRELKHIDYARHLINADFNRAKREIQRRIDFFQTLQEQNRERQKKRDIAWCEDEEKDWERKARAARRRRTLPKIKVYKNHKAEAVGSIRRDQKREFANKMTNVMSLNRSLDALTNSYAKRKTRNEQTEDEKSIKGSLEDEPKPTQPKYGMPATQTLSLPELPASKTGPKKSSLSQMISSGETKFPGIGANEKQQVAAPGKPTNTSLRTFYMNTSTNSQPAVNVSDRGRRRVSIVDPTTQTKTRRVPALKLGPQQNIPLRFYEPETNPFLNGDNVTPTNRSSELLNANKADEMYIWLGFDSEEEYEKLKRGELVLEFDDEAGSDTSSNVDANDRRLRELTGGGDARPIGETPDHLTRRSESKLGAPRIMIASANDTRNLKGLDRFANAAKMVMIVRQFQTSILE
ncbi:uncharacterized protein LOC117287866 [Asterias rubens]|uniref:uncharacterized protein LOC117287866 n=1 Tax=Asterias rubens TaxID=7604 RepID=UPI001455450D|nr:uncharacterized protein LOC117287866 [Asterias rubens]